MKNKSQEKMSVSHKIAQLSSVKKKNRESFIQAMKDEMKKVSWTGKEELTSLAKVVVVSIFVLGLSIYLIDLAIRGMLQGVGTLLYILGI
ncbi:MAG: preprotein translocase subunit SecE [Simkania negevensis]|nr:preprotein translocase subunit SecE [Simkania negevensis]